LEWADCSTGNIVSTTSVAMERLASGWTIMNIHLNVLARLSKVTQAQFIDATVRAKTSCMVSRLSRASTSMNVKLETKSPSRRGNITQSVQKKTRHYGGNL
jgi:organic hydroperoxide reductase OsmC/OhrA